MAFGMEMGSKLFLTLFRIVAVGLLIYYLCRIRNRSYIKTGYLVCIAMITAGAAGNIVDSGFYGVMFPLFSFYWPDWVPFVGGNFFLFFQPIFNIADSAITVGIFVLIIFYSKYLSNMPKDEAASESETSGQIEK